jgi:hypothetical protein
MSLLDLQGLETDRSDGDDDTDENPQDSVNSITLTICI